jgi:hypothetical protein
MAKNLCEIWLELLRGVPCDETVDKSGGIGFTAGANGACTERLPRIPQQRLNVGVAEHSDGDQFFDQRSANQAGGEGISCGTDGLVHIDPPQNIDTLPIETALSRL